MLTFFPFFCERVRATRRDTSLPRSPCRSTLSVANRVAKRKQNRSCVCVCARNGVMHVSPSSSNSRPIISRSLDRRGRGAFSRLAVCFILRRASDCTSVFFTSFYDLLRMYFVLPSMFLKGQKSSGVLPRPTVQQAYPAIFRL